MDKDERGRDDSGNRPIENWLARELEEMQKPPVISDAVCKMAIMYGENVNLRGREVRDVARDSFDWNFNKDADLVALAYYHANLHVSMRSMEVRK